MKQVISIKIDVSKIDKSKLYKGEKGIYLDAVLMYNSEPDQYGQNGMIVQSVSKEEREKGVKGEILGNAKVLSTPSQAQTTETDILDDLPF